jgi:hypothetical protein
MFAAISMALFRTATATAAQTVPERLSMSTGDSFSP